MECAPVCRRAAAGNIGQREVGRLTDGLVLIEEVGTRSRSQRGGLAQLLRSLALEVLARGAREEVARAAPRDGQLLAQDGAARGGVVQNDEEVRSRPREAQHRKRRFAEPRGCGEAQREHDDAGQDPRDRASTSAGAWAGLNEAVGAKEHALDVAALNDLEAAANGVEACAAARSCAAMPHWEQRRRQPWPRSFEAQEMGVTTPRASMGLSQTIGFMVGSVERRRRAKHRPSGGWSNDRCQLERDSNVGSKGF